MTMTAEKTAPTPAFDDIDTWVKDALARPDSFLMWNDDPRMFVTWSLGPVIETRDSDSIQRSNAIALKKELEEYSGWEIHGCSHWAVGHVDHLSFKVLCKAKPDDTEYLVPSRPGYKLTKIARFIKKWFDDLEEFPIADEDALSNLELEESLEAIEKQSPDCLHGTDLQIKDKLPEDWVNQVFRKLDRQGGISHSGGGAWADEDKLIIILKELDFVQPVPE
jgi:hypothetical protein